MDVSRSTSWLIREANQVVADPLRFKARLEIGEAAYTSLLVRSKAAEAWGVAGMSAAGAAVAGSSVVANAFFGATGIMGLIATASTPIGWIVAAGVVAGGSSFGIIKLMKGLDSERVEVIPKFINTPLDVLAVGLFDLAAPLVLKIAAADGSVTAEEREVICAYFIEDWGYDPSYVHPALDYFHESLNQFTLQELTESFRKFTLESKDCNHKIVRERFLALLTDIASADGQIHEMEELAIQHVSACLPKDPWFKMPLFRTRVD